MLSFISAKETAEKWEISQRRVAVLCSEGRIEGAMMVGNMWIIPSNAEKPADLRITKQDNIPNPSLKPFVKWAGGKSRMVEQIAQFLPEKDSEESKNITKYCEPMVGGGAFLFSVLENYNFEKIAICDTNKELINAYKVIRANVDELVKLLDEMQAVFLPMNDNGRKYFYYNVRDKFNQTELKKETAVEKASMFIFLNKTCFNGLYRVSKKGLYNVPMGSYKNPLICDETNLRNISEALQNVEILCGDYTLCKDFIDEKTFVYIDPPYRPISNTSGFTSYTADNFSDEDQQKLGEFAKELSDKGATVVLSNSDPKNINPDDNFFDDLYKDFKIHRVEASRMINSKSSGRGKITELLISNK